MYLTITILRNAEHKTPGHEKVRAGNVWQTFEVDLCDNAFLIPILV